MAGSATLNPEVLVDDLVDVIDELRGDLHPSFGVRPYKLSTVLRTWSGVEQGEGDYQDVVTEISPQPRVFSWNGYHWVETAVGIHEDGDIRVTEVSLTYTFDELTGGRLNRNQQFFMRIEEANGQGSRVRTLRNKTIPYVDREKDMGWVLVLSDYQEPGSTT